MRNDPESAGKMAGDCRPIRISNGLKKSVDRFSRKECLPVVLNIFTPGIRSDIIKLSKNIDAGCSGL